MRKLTLPFALTATLLLAACSDNDATAVVEAPQTAAEGILTEAYHCAHSDLMFSVTYAEDTAVLTLNQQEHLMKIDVSASGARYVGDDGLEWHVKAGEGVLTQGEETETCTLVE